MKILFLDSAAKTAKVFVTENGIRLGSAEDFGEKTHASALIPMVDQALKQAGFSLSDIDVIGAANGPGSYTGIRIGVSAAKLLAYGSGKPLVPVNTLDYLAASAGGSEGDVVVSLLDARNTLCFWASYLVKNGRPVRLTEYGSHYADEILRTDLVSGSNRLVFTGDGAMKNREMILNAFPAGSVRIPDDNDATGTAAAADKLVREKFSASGDPSDFSPEKAAAEYFKEVHITVKKEKE